MKSSAARFAGSLTTKCKARQHQDDLKFRSLFAGGPSFMIESKEQQGRSLTDNPCDSCAWTTQAANVMQQLHDLRDSQRVLGDRLEAHAIETRRGFDSLNATIASQVDTSSVRAHARIDGVTKDVAEVRSQVSEAKGKLLVLVSLIGTAISSAVSLIGHFLGGGAGRPPTGH